MKGFILCLLFLGTVRFPFVSSTTVSNAFHRVSEVVNSTLLTTSLLSEGIPLENEPHMQAIPPITIRENEEDEEDKKSKDVLFFVCGLIGENYPKWYYGLQIHNSSFLANQFTFVSYHRYLVYHSLRI